MARVGSGMTCRIIAHLGSSKRVQFLHRLVIEIQCTVRFHFAALKYIHGAQGSEVVKNGRLPIMGYRTYTTGTSLTSSMRVL